MILRVYYPSLIYLTCILYLNINWGVKGFYLKTKQNNVRRTSRLASTHSRLIRCMLDTKFQQYWETRFLSFSHFNSYGKSEHPFEQRSLRTIEHTMRLKILVATRISTTDSMGIYIYGQTREVDCNKINTKGISHTSTKLHIPYFVIMT